MEKDLLPILNSREYLQYISKLSDVVLRILNQKDTSDIKKGILGEDVETVFEEVHKIIEMSDRVKDVKRIHPMKHKLKIILHEVRYLSKDQNVSSASVLASKLQDLLESSIKLLSLLNSVELNTLEKLSGVAKDAVIAVGSISKEMDARPLFMDYFKSLSQFICAIKERFFIHCDAKQQEEIGATVTLFKFYFMKLFEVVKILICSGENKYAAIARSFVIQQNCFCLSRMCNIICHSSDEVTSEENDCGSFVKTVDELLAHLSKNHKWEDKEDLHELIDSIITHSMSVCHLSEATAKERIVYRSQRVLKQRLALEEVTKELEAAPDDISVKTTYSKQCDKLSEDIEALEREVNISIIHLVITHYMRPFQTFEDLLQASYQHCSGNPEAAETASTKLKPEIEAFYQMSDTTYHVARFAAACSTETKWLTLLITHLKALEWLDPELVPAVISYTQDFEDKNLLYVLNLLSDSWHYHVKGLFDSLLHITDFSTFSDCVEEILRHDMGMLEKYLETRDSNLLPQLRSLCFTAKYVKEMASVLMEDFLETPVSLVAVIDQLKTVIKIVDIVIKDLSQRNEVVSEKVKKKAGILVHCVKKVCKESKMLIESSCKSDSTLINHSDHSQMLKKRDEESTVCPSNNNQDFDLTALLEKMNSQTSLHTSNKKIQTEDEQISELIAGIHLSVCAKDKTNTSIKNHLEGQHGLTACDKTGNCHRNKDLGVSEIQDLTVLLQTEYKKLALYEGSDQRNRTHVAETQGFKRAEFPSFRSLHQSKLELPPRNSFVKFPRCKSTREKELPPLKECVLNLEKSAHLLSEVVSELVAKDQKKNKLVMLSQEIRGLLFYLVNKQFEKTSDKSNLCDDAMVLAKKGEEFVQELENLKENNQHMSSDLVSEMDGHSQQITYFVQQLRLVTAASLSNEDSDKVRVLLLLTVKQLSKTFLYALTLIHIIMKQVTGDEKKRELNSKRANIASKLNASVGGSSIYRFMPINTSTSSA